ncbi:MAG: YebF family protein [Rahnella inusitata]|jgi:hypothetical protein|uniref:YebF family protein n=1 Tax=Rahnella inusitata TaxID=58169 RepID=UPI0017C41D09|nr:colicin M resistance protein [Serratia sp. (in: enterobacteria)]
MSKVVLIGIISFIFLMMVVMLGSVYIYPWWMQRSTEGACAQITKSDAIDTVTRDYMENRIPNWGNDKDNMGTSVPVLSFISDDAKEDKGTYHIPFSAKGPNGTLGYVAHFNCSNHYVKYSTVE